MFFKTKFAKYYYLTIKNSVAPSCWLLLHGFMGSHKEYLNIAKKLPGIIIIPDLLGHGKSNSDSNTNSFSIEQQADDLAALSRQIATQKINVWGYSMGGRLALALTLRHPDLVNQLYLESSTAGIKDDIARKNRINNDRQLASRLQTDGLTDFVNFWESLPLFSSQKLLPPKIQKFVRTQRLQQSNTELSKSLLGMGTGQMPNYWDKLSSLQVKTTLFTGELDSKFNSITHDMQLLIPNSERFVISGAGHNVHLEKPNEILAIIYKKKCL
ncbi:MAG: 2-succinyl-6-hydroxy-2,4-cyclohexadiene-1-carboxylate synthase [Liquorilactobacillus sp.]|uniref:2-succinyl-6-hydroxy-2, 4-cyclohexadiene-1-carboxylate synthase n=1 Tax=Liquorilactobacillus sp. TaxID=2767923 RepID=UPI0039EC02C7